MHTFFVYSVLFLGWFSQMIDVVRSDYCDPFWIAKAENIRYSRSMRSKGTTAHFECKKCYYLSPSGTKVTCSYQSKEKGQWTPSKQCLRVKCPKPKSISREAGVYSPGSPSTDCESSFKMTAYSGYLIAGKREVTYQCQQNRKWSPNLRYPYNISTYENCRYRTSNYPAVQASNKLESIKACRIFCAAKGYSLSGMIRRGNRCYCSDEAEDFGNVAGQNIRCNKVCPDQKDYYCGNYYYFAVYWTMGGCYNVPSGLTTVMNTRSTIFTSPLMKIAYCAEYCRGNLFLYSSVKSDTCYCSKQIDVELVPADLSCTTPCPGNAATKCGGPSAVSLSNLNSRKGSKSATCEEHFDAGIHATSVYFLAQKTGITTTYKRRFCQMKDGTECSNGWIGFRGSCYFFSPHTKTLNAHRAQEKCREMEASLVSIHTNEEQDFVSRTLEFYANVSKIAYAYIGLYDYHKKNVGTWLDGTILNFTFFRRWNPHLYSKNCYLIPGKPTSRRWIDVECERTYPYICKKSFEGGNLVRKKPATQSSTLSTFASKLAVDGERHIANTSCSITQSENQPWWAVTLDGSTFVHRVNIRARGICCVDGLQEYKIFLQDGNPSNGLTLNSDGLCYHFTSAVSMGAQLTIYCNKPIAKKYLVIQSVLSNVKLSLCEVEVFTLPKKGYLGCFPMRGSGGNAYSNANMTLAFCFEHCRGVGDLYRYALVVNDTCSCATDSSVSSVFRLAERNKMATCDTPCPGNTLQMCGKSDSHVSVYITDGNPKAASCSDLYHNDVGSASSKTYVIEGSNSNITCDMSADLRCPRSWFHYKNLCYKYERGLKYLKDSLSLCASQNSLIASIEDRDENDFIGQLMKKTKFYEGSIWYGLGYDVTLGLKTFRWTDGRIFKYTQWGPTEPQNGIHKYILTRRVDHENWFDVSNFQFGVVCKSHAGYEGCYGPLPSIVPAVTSDHMTITLCVERCRGTGTKLAALWNETCYCVDSINGMQKYSGSDCVLPCAGNALSVCGGNGKKASVFTVAQYQTLGESCYDLYEQGVVEPGYSVIDPDKSGPANPFKTFCGVADSTTCPTGWRGFRGNCYQFIKENLNMTEANNDCFNRGGTLTSVLTPAEYSFIITTIKTSAIYSQQQKWYIGLSIPWPDKKIISWTDGHLYAYKFESPTSNISLGNCAVIDRTLSFRWLYASCHSDASYICKIGKDHKGCYTRPSFAPFLSNFGDMTNTVCREICRGNKNEYSGTEDGKNCYCFSHASYNSLTSADFQDCSTPCLGNPQQMCGAKDRINVFFVGKECPVGWTLLDSSCLKMNSTGVGFYEAQFQCRAENEDVDLADASSAEKRSKLNTLRNSGKSIWVRPNGSSSFHILGDATQLTSENVNNQHYTLCERPRGPLEPVLGKCEELYELDIHKKSPFTLDVDGFNSGSLAVTTECGFTDNTPCQTNWFGYGGSCYIFLPSSSSFATASTECYSLDGAFPVAVNSQEEGDFLFKVASAMPYIRAQKSWHIGSVDAYYHKTRVTVDGSIPTYANYAPGEPRHYKAGLTPCTILSMDSGTWNADYCTSPSGIICEKHEGIKGCHSNDDNGFITFQDDILMSIQTCVEFCRGQGATYAALNSTVCACHKSISMAKVTDSLCTHKCSGNAYQTCGGPGTVSVHFIEKYRHIASSCDELYEHGLRAKSRYFVMVNATSILAECFFRDSYIIADYLKNHASLMDSSTPYNNQKKYGPTNGRLNADIIEGFIGINGPAKVWVTVEFQNFYVLEALATKGRIDNQWVTRMEMWYSHNGVDWMKHPKDLIGNYDVNSRVMNFFQSTIVTAQVKLIIKNFYGHPSLRFDFLGGLYGDMYNFGGFLPISATGYHKSDNSTYIPNPASGFGRKGTIIGWRAHTVSDNDLFLQVWRPLGGLLYLLVAQTLLSGSEGIREVLLSREDEISVNRDDVFGLSFLSESPMRFIKYTCTDATLLYVRKGKHDIGDKLTFIRRASDCRHYAFTAILRGFFQANGEYQGCYVAFNSSLSGFPILQTAQVQTPDACIYICRQQNFAYAALHDGTRCSCLNSFVRYGKVDDPACHLQCPGDTAQRCGATDKYSIYRAWIKHCGHPPVVGNATVNLNSSVNLFRTELKYTCNQGFEYDPSVTSHTIICQQNNNWTNSQTSCIRKKCTNSPPTVKNATSVASDPLEFGVNSSVVYTCLAGHVFPVDNSSTYTIKCQENKQWETAPSACVARHCSQPNVTNFAIMVMEGTHVTAQVHYNCISGHILHGMPSVKQTIQCQTNAQWSYIPSDCHRHPFYTGCFKMTAVTAAVTVSLDTMVTGGDNPIEKCRNHCKVLDSTYIGLSVANCMCLAGAPSSGNVTDNKCDAHCKAGDTSFICGGKAHASVYVSGNPCPTLPSLANAVTNDTSRMFNSIANYTCQPGWKLPNGSLFFEMRCNANEMWQTLNPPYTGCTEVYSDLPDIDLTDVRYMYTSDYYWSFTPVADQSECAYNSSWGDPNSGYILSGQCASLNTGRRSRGFFNVAPGAYTELGEGVGINGSSIQLSGSPSSCAELGNFSVGDHRCLVDPDKCKNGITVAFWVNVKHALYNTTSQKQMLVASGPGTRGFKVYLEGFDVNVVVTNDTATWKARMFGQIKGNAWTNVAFRWSAAHGLEVSINGLKSADVLEAESLGSTSTPSSTITLGCRYSDASKTIADVTAASFDEIAVWRWRLRDKERPFLVGGNVPYPIEPPPPASAISTTPGPIDYATDIKEIEIPDEGTNPYDQTADWYIPLDATASSSAGMTSGGGVEVELGRADRGKALVLPKVTSYLKLSKEGSKCHGDISVCSIGLSLSVWIKLPRFIEPGFSAVILRGDMRQSGEQGYQIAWTSNQLQLTVSYASKKFVCSTTPHVHSWVNVAFTWRGDKGITLYLNGEVACSSATSTSSSGLDMRSGSFTDGDIVLGSTEGNNLPGVVISDLTVWWRYLYKFEHGRFMGMTLDEENKLSKCTYFWSTDYFVYRNLKAVARIRPMYVFEKTTVEFEAGRDQKGKAVRIKPDRNAWIMLGLYNQPFSESIGRLSWKCLSNPALCSKGLSLSIWLKMYSSGDANKEYILSTGAQDSQSVGYGLYVENGLMAAKVANGTHTWEVKISAGLYNLGEWINIGFSYDKHLGLWFYLNGNLEAVNGQGRLDPRPSDRFTRFVIGRSNEDNDFGRFADFAFEDLTIMESFIPPNQFVKSFFLPETAAYSYTGSSKYLTSPSLISSSIDRLVTGKSLSSSPHLNTAPVGPNLDLIDGISRITGGSSWTVIEFFASSCFINPTACPRGLSLSTWLKLTPASGAGSVSYDFISSNPDVSSAHYRLRNENGYIKVYIGTASKKWEAVSSKPLPVSVWTNVGFTWSPSEGLSIYFNGKGVIHVKNGERKSHTEPSSSFISIGTNETSANGATVEIGNIVIWQQYLGNAKLSLLMGISAAEMLKNLAADYYFPFEGTLHTFSRQQITFHNGAKLTLDAKQTGGAVSLDSSQSQWVSLGNFKDQCIVSPSDCSKGFVIGFKYHIKEDKSGMLFSSGGQNEASPGVAIRVTKDKLLNIVVADGTTVWDVLAPCRLNVWTQLAVKWTSTIGITIELDGEAIPESIMSSAKRSETRTAKQEIVTLGKSNTADLEFVTARIDDVLISYDAGSPMLSKGFCYETADFNFDLNSFASFPKTNTESYPDYYGVDGGSLKTQNGFIDLGSFASKCASNPALCADGITVSVWVKILEKVGSTEQYILNSGYPNSPGIGIYVVNSGSETSVVFAVRAGEYEWKSKSRAAIIDTTYWNNFAMTWTSSQGLRVFVNGTKKDYVDSGSSVTNISDSHTNVLLGKANFANSHYLTAAFDAVAIWNQALSHTLTNFDKLITGEACKAPVLVTPGMYDNGNSTNGTGRCEFILDGVCVRSMHELESQLGKGLDRITALKLLDQLSNQTKPYDKKELLDTSFLSSVDGVHTQLIQSLITSGPVVLTKSECQQELQHVISVSNNLIYPIPYREKWITIHKERRGFTQVIRNLEKYMVQMTHRINMNPNQNSHDPNSTQPTVPPLKSVELDVNVENILTHTQKTDVNSFVQPYIFPDHSDATVNLTIQRWKPRRVTDIITLSPTLFKKLQQAHGNVSVTVSSMLFDAVHKFLPTASSIELPPYDPSNDNVPEIVSRVLTTAVYPEISDGLLDYGEIVFLLSHTRRNFGKKRDIDCVFWNYSLEINATGAVNGAWDTSGCKVEATNETHTTCSCTHLTNFALLLQPIPRLIPDYHKDKLSIVTYAGLALSLVCLTTFLYVLIANKSLRHERNSIHLNLVISSLLAHLSFLMVEAANNDKQFCEADSVLMHYFYTVANMWVLIEAVYLFNGIINGIIYRKIKLYAALSWGIPFLIVVGMMCIKLDLYGANMRCWPSEEMGYMLIYVGTILLILAFAGLLLGIVLCNVMNPAIQNPDIMNELRSLLCCTVAILPLFATSWIFGLVSINSHDVALHYVFAVFNSLQGVIIFLLFGFGSPEVRQAMFSRSKAYQLHEEEIESESADPAAPMEIGPDSHLTRRKKQDTEIPKVYIP